MEANQQTGEVSENEKSRRQIRVSNEVFVELQKRATPLTDTPDKVLRRVLGIDSIPQTEN